MLVTNSATQFTSRGKDAISRLFWYLWENKEVFDIFVDNYLNQQCKQLYESGQLDKLQDLLELVVHRLFVDLTS